MKPVAVLGCGPAGLMAAQAVAIAGRELVVISRPEKSRLGGAQFLHQPIPAINDAEPDVRITYRKFGDEATYREKVYGEEYVPFTSFGAIEDGQEQWAWNLIETYDRLWELYGPHVNDINVGPQWLDDHLDDFSLVFSTVPLPLICRTRAGLDQGMHSFRVQDIKVSTDRWSREVADDTIVYDGTKEHSWYRASCLFGHHGTEWSAGVTPPIPNLIHDRKPISTSCDCYEGKVIRLGRRGTWRKGVLTHDAFFGAMEVLM